MWECPRCGREFANANQWHSCIELAVDEYLAGKSPHAVVLYHAIHAALREAGEFRVHPQQSRIAFISRMTFAGVQLAERWVVLSFITASPIDHERIRRIELYGPTSFAHAVRIATPAEVDGVVGGWLQEALLRGDQETLDPSASIRPVTGRPLGLLVAPVVGRAVDLGDELALEVPRYVGEAFGAAPGISVRIRGEAHRAQLGRGSGKTRIVFDRGRLRELGLGARDAIDVRITANLER